MNRDDLEAQEEAEEEEKKFVDFGFFKKGKVIIKIKKRICPWLHEMSGAKRFICEEAVVETEAMKHRPRTRAQDIFVFRETYARTQRTLKLT